MPTARRSPLSFVKKHPVWFAIALAVLLGAVYFIFGNQAPPPNYITATAEIGDINQNILATGKIEAKDSVNVGAEASGKITKLFVKLGDKVQKGDPIAQIDPLTQENELAIRDLTLLDSQTALESARAARLMRQSDIATAKTALELRQSELAAAERAHARLTDLIAIDAISQQEYADSNAKVTAAHAAVANARAALDSSQNALIVSETDIARAQSAIKRAENERSIAAKTLANTKVVAPIDGVVVSIPEKQGATINTAQSSPTIVTIAVLDTLRIAARLSEADVARATIGMPATFNLLGDPENTYTTTLDSIDPLPESSDGAIYYIGYLDVDNKDGKFLLQMTAQVNLIEQSAKNVLTVPAAALKNSDAGTIVRVLQQNGQVVDMPVVVGLNNRILAEIKSGLTAGDVVILGDDASEKSDRTPPML